jgi:hypothetical protein
MAKSRKRRKPSNSRTATPLSDKQSLTDAEQTAVRSALERTAGIPIHQITANDPHRDVSSEITLDRTQVPEYEALVRRYGIDVVTEAHGWYNRQRPAQLPMTISSI